MLRQRRVAFTEAGTIGMGGSSSGETQPGRRAAGRVSPELLAPVSIVPAPVKSADKLVDEQCTRLRASLQEARAATTDAMEACHFLVLKPACLSAYTCVSWCVPFCLEFAYHWQSSAMVWQTQVLMYDLEQAQVVHATVNHHHKACTPKEAIISLDKAQCCRVWSRL